MPIYEYHCEGCKQTFEIIQKFSDPPKQACDQCGGQLTKLVSQSAFHLKGSGWYVTDYKRKPSSDSTKDSKNSAEGKKSESKSQDKKDSKKVETSS